MEIPSYPESGGVLFENMSSVGSVDMLSNKAYSEMNEMPNMSSVDMFSNKAYSEMNEMMNMSSVDMFSNKAYSEMNEMMARSAAKHAEKYKKLSVGSRFDKYRTPETISRMRLVNPLSGFINVLCIGHPLLHYDAFVDKNFLKKYGIKMGCKYARERDTDFIADFLKFASGNPGCGGDIVKIAQAAQWVLLYPKSVGFIGAFAGNTHLDDIIYCMEEMNLGHKIKPNAGVKTSYLFTMRYGKRWSEVYIIDSKAASMSVAYFDQPQVANSLERAQVIFLSTTSCFQMDQEVSKLAYFSSSHFKTLCVQICERVIMETKPEVFKNLIPYIDTLFINKEEAFEMLDVFKIPAIKMWPPSCSAKTATLRIGKWIDSLSRKSCTVVLYDSIKVAYVITYKESPTVETFRSQFYKTSNVVDLYGCECAFSGGYIGQMVQGNDIPACIDCAFFCASAVATQWGAKFPLNRLERFNLWHAQSRDEVNRKAFPRSFFTQDFACCF